MTARTPIGAMARVGCVALTLAVPVATWWAVGPLDEVEPGPTADFMYEPPDIDSAVERFSGVVASLVVLGCVALLVRERRHGRWDRRWWSSAVVPSVLIGLYVALAARVITAAVGGANMGGGMALLAGVPIIGFLLGWSIVAGARNRSLRPQSG